MNFVAIDVGTANPKLESICQIGVAVFDKGKLEKTWMTHVNPEDVFDKEHASNYGLTKFAVENTPTLPDIYPYLKKLIENQVVVCHTLFEMMAINRAFKKYNLPSISSVWLDSTVVARKIWSDLAFSGCGLEALCKKIDHPFSNENALNDAVACGEVFVSAMNKGGYDLSRVRNKSGLFQQDI